VIVEQIWTDNKFRNFNYLIVCPETGQAMAVDPLEHEQCLRVAKENGWEITEILNTHHHHDHIGGNAPLVEATGARILAHAMARDEIPDMDVGLSAGDVVTIGKTVELEVLDTPGHTMSHVCLFARTDHPALICGDTLFNAGAGHCKGGGQPEPLYQTFATQLAKLPDNTRIFPGHDYIENNLAFTLDREPDNARAAKLKEEVAGQDTNEAFVTTLGLEKEVNTFFRLHNPTVIARLKEAFPDLPDEPDEKTVFLKLRELRNDW